MSDHEEMTLVGYTEHGDPVDVALPMMTMRQWYAGQALAGLASQGLSNVMPDREIVKDAYSLADAMLAERQKEKAP